MTAFFSGVQDFVDTVLHGDPNAVIASFQRAMELSASASRAEAGGALLGLAEMLAAPRTRYGGMVACLAERCLGAGGDPWVGTGLIVERCRDALTDAARFHAACEQRLRAVGLAVNETSDEAGAIRRQIASQDPAGAITWAELDLWCMSALGLLDFFVEARTLFRYLGGSVEELRPMAAVREGPAQFAKVLEQHAGEVVPPGYPSAAFESARERLIDCTRRDGGEGSIEALQELYQSLFCIDLATRNQALSGLAEVLRGCDLGHTGDLAQACGGLVETGGDQSLAIDAIVERLREVLPEAERFVHLCLDTARREGVKTDEEEPTHIIEAFADRVAEELPEGARAWDAVGPLCLGAIAHLSRSVEKRREVFGDESLLRPALALADVCGPAAFLVKMLQVLDDEELLVLAPAEKLGWRVRISGVGDNFQLHTLLAGALVGPVDQGGYPGLVGVMGDGGQENLHPGRPLSRRVVGVARDLPCSEREPSVWSFLQLWNWPALQEGGKLPADALRHSDHFVWNEGVPADVLPFEGTRLVLLGKAPFSRSWNGGRIFHGMKARLEVEGRLTAEEVEGWLARLESAPRPEDA